MIKRISATFEGQPDCTQQCGVIEWLRQELDGSRLHGLNSYRDVAKTRNEDDRHVRPVDCDALLQIEAVETRKSNVENQTARDMDSWARQEVLCGLESFWLPTCVADQQFERLAHRYVVVNDEHD